VSETQTGWTKSQVTAYPYIQKGVADGLTATAALKQFRAGGGSIRDAYWYALFREDFAQSGVRENILEIPMTYTIPDTMFQSVDYDYREKYVMQMKVRGYSQELDRTVTRWITAENDTMITKREWTYLAAQAIYDTIGSPPMIISSIVEWNPLKRSGILEW